MLTIGKTDGKNNFVCILEIKDTEKIAAEPAWLEETVLKAEIIKDRLM